MANDERIKVWRAQRSAGILPTDPQASALRQASRKIAALIADPGSVPASAIVRIAVESLAAFPEQSLGERRGVYNQMAEGVQAAIEEQRLPETLASYWSRRVGLVTRTLERDIRQGVDLFAEGYVPDGLAEADGQLLTRLQSQTRRERAIKLREERREATRRDVVFPISMPPRDMADLATLRILVNSLHDTQRPVENTVPRVLTILPLFFLRLNIIRADSKIALIWVFIGPVALMCVFSGMYFLNGIRFVLGMDVLTFTLTGAVTWIMFRMIVFRSSESYFSGRQFVTLGPVTPLAMALVNSFFYMVVYLTVMMSLVTIGHLIGVVSLPDNIPGVVACVAGVALVAASFGLIFAGITSKWEYFIRFAPFIERALQLFSSVFIVTEQLPAYLRPYFLWWPLSHGFQLLRSCYFVTYKSQDASLTYFVVAVILFVAAGLVSDRLARSNVQPL